MGRPEIATPVCALARNDTKGGVSVIIPVYRGEKTLGRAVRSALTQPETGQVIVINDGSPENIDGVMASFSDERILYLKNDSNRGVAYSRNRGVAEAKFPYVAFLDADDEWEAGKLGAQLRALEGSGAALCCTGRRQRSPDGALTDRILGVPERISYEDLLKHNCIACSSVVLGRDVALRFPMDHDEGCHEDYLLWLRILRDTGDALGVNEPLVRYTAGSQGKSGSKWRSARMTWRVYRVMGFGLFQSVKCFVSYAVNGVKKHYL